MAKFTDLKQWQSVMSNVQPLMTSRAYQEVCSIVPKGKENGAMLVYASLCKITKKKVKLLSTVGWHNYKRLFCRSRESGDSSQMEIANGTSVLLFLPPGS